MQKINGDFLGAQQQIWLMVVWCLTALSAPIHYIVPCPSRKLILQIPTTVTPPIRPRLMALYKCALIDWLTSQLAEPRFEPQVLLLVKSKRCFHCSSKYCKHSVTEADKIWLTSFLRPPMTLIRLVGSTLSSVKEPSEITGHVLFTSFFTIVFVTPHEQCQNTESIQQYSTTWLTK